MASETPEQLIARMNAKYGVSGNSQPVEQPAPAPAVQQPAKPDQTRQQVPQPGGIAGIAAGILGKRKEQIDKATGYNRGGIVKGKGGIDQVPMEISGAKVNLTGGKTPEAVLPGKTVQALGGPAAVEALIEATNGKPPVKDGLKEGGSYDNGGLLDEEKKKTDTVETLTNGPYTGDGGSVASDFKAWQANKIAETNAKIDAAIGKPAANISAPGAQGQFKTPSEFDKKITDIEVPGTKFITGAKEGDFPTSAQGGFTQGGKSFNVNGTSQDGITRVTAPGTAPLFTNTNPEAAVTGLANQQVSSDAEGLARMANANKIRGQMIANRDKDIPAGGYGPGILGDGGIEAANAEKTTRWRQDDLINLAKRGNQAAIAAAINANAHSNDVAGTNATHIQTAAMQSDATKRGHEVNAQIAAGHDSTLMRNTDVNAENDKEKNGILATQVKLPNYSNRYITLPNRKIYNELGQVTGEEPGGIFDAATGQPVQSQPQASARQQAPASAVAMLKSDPKKYGEAFKAKYGYLPEGV